ncbi:MAG: DUF1015 domain-containing protein [Flavobacteriales bacterium]|nr:DUF1015 domain-containing protein [Bacteroidota bacterium]MCB9239721.1 DUF1015 domain-containing protein [Flavobacteriales bacterium]
MPDFLPFKAFMPDSEHVTDVALSSSDFENERALVSDLQSNPNNFLHVTKLPLKFPNRWEQPLGFMPEARNFVDDLIKRRILNQPDREAYYVYRQVIDGTAHTGLVGLCDMEDYDQNRIKRHEHTRHEREAFISELISRTGIIGEPVLLAHHHRQTLQDLLQMITSESPEMHFELGGREHSVWVINDSDTCASIRQEMQNAGDFYIMDGHHRIASISNLYQSNRDQNSRFALSYVLDANQLAISPFHRFIRNVGKDLNEVRTLLEPEFEFKEVGNYVMHPEHQRSFVMKCTSGTFMLTARNSWGGLDVDLFDQKIAGPVFDVHDSRSDTRIDFYAGDAPVREVMSTLEHADDVLFLLHPCTFREIAMTSDASRVLPPKSTFVEPKCRPGLFVQPFGPNPIA